MLNTLPLDIEIYPESLENNLQALTNSQSSAMYSAGSAPALAPVQWKGPCVCLPMENLTRTLVMRFTSLFSLSKKASLLIQVTAGNHLLLRVRKSLVFQ